MEQDKREQLLNQFFLNNMNPSRIDMGIIKFKNPREALAKRIYVDKNLCDYNGDFRFCSYYTRTYLPESFFKDYSLVNMNNDPFERCIKCNVINKASSLRFRDANSVGPYYNSQYSAEGERQIKDELAEREMIETNLTYDGYCVFLSMLPDQALLYFKDSIIAGINNEARANLSAVTSTEELNTVHQDFLQLKAAAEYLVETAQMREEITMSEAYNNNQCRVALEPKINEALQDFT